jgi:NADPH-dependent 2,4-dienoyl-CoA reductase/sulfur reductase-like enzyme
LRLGVGVEGLHSDRLGRARSVALSDGTEVRCDAALVGIGAEPADELLGGGTAGIPTDAAGRTELPGVYACGDVAAAWRPSRQAHVRIEHWTNAARQGGAVADAILGRDAAGAEEPPFFWSDQFGLRLQYVGDAVGHATVELDGSPEAFRADYLDREGRLLAALAVNRPHEVGALRRALAA